LDTSKPFDPFVDRAPSFPIRRITELLRRARHLIKDRPLDQLRSAVDTIAWIEQEFFYRDKEQWIQRQLEIGGHILGYLHPDERNEATLRDLAEYRPHTIGASEFDFASEENTGQLEALENGMELFDLDDMDLPGAAPYEYVAVLGIVLIGQAIRYYLDDSIDWPGALQDDQHIIRLESLSNSVVDIVEVVCRAEELKNQHMAARRYSRLLRDSEKNLPSMAEQITKQKISIAATRAAQARHEKAHGADKIRALAHWDAQGDRFSGKTIFARLHCREYNVTEATLIRWITAHEKMKTAR
jgi:hypothetical protein